MLQNGVMIHLIHSRLITKDQISARIEELKRTICDGVVQLAIRERSARVQILQDNLDRLRNVIAARAFEYADHLGGATGMLVKDYRGKNAEREIYRFDAALVAQMNDTLKQAAIEEGQWTEKRETAGTNINVLMDLINEGRSRVADEQEAREATRGTKTLNAETTLVPITPDTILAREMARFVGDGRSPTAHSNSPSAIEAPASKSCRTTSTG